MILLDKKDIKMIFTMKDAIEANKQAFRIYSQGGSDTPLRVNIDVSKFEGNTLFMPGYIGEIDGMGVKIVSIFPLNRKRGMPSLLSTMLLIDATSGEVCCIMDGTYLTQLRTGAASGAATDILARPDARIGALIGVGGQGFCQLEAMLTVRNLEEVRIYDIDFERAKLFTDQMRDELAQFKTRLVTVATSSEAIENADIITTVTTAKQPVFDGQLVKPGAHINGVGSFMPQMQELDEYLIKRADKIFFDSQEAVLAEAGDFIIPLSKGIVTKNDFSGEIGQVISGVIKGRESANEITLFKTVGISAEDVVTANHIYRKALNKSIGQEFCF